MRIEYEGAWYHVMNRGRRAERIYGSRQDYLQFIELLKESAELWEVKISAYCLMANHYHLLIHTPKGNLSRCMRHINGVYTQRFNKSNGCDGSLFRGRFKSVLVDGDSYLLQLVRYIHRNPLRAGVVNNLKEFSWSSHKAYLSSAAKWDWLYKDFILSLLSNERGNRLQAYRLFMEMEDSGESCSIFEKKRWPVFLGDESFFNWLKDRFFENKRHREIPQSLALAPPLAAIRQAVCSHYQIDESELMRSGGRTFNEPRNMAIYAARMLRKDSLDVLAVEFGLKSYSSISSILQQVRRRLAEDGDLQNSYEQIIRLLLKGQMKTPFDDPFPFRSRFAGRQG